MSNCSLKDRVVWLTGASGHLGEAIAFALASAGAHPILSGRSSEKLETLASRLRGDGARVWTLPFDLERMAERESSMAWIRSEIGQLDGLVNNAYAGRAGTVESATVVDFELAFTFNLAGPFHLIQLALPLLKESGRRNVDGAAIVNIASMYGIVSPDPSVYRTGASNNPPFYGATKAGLIQLTRYLACHLAPSNIRVNSVSPGPFPRPEIRTTNPDFHAELCAKVPMGRIGRAPEVGGPVVFLLSQAASFVTGADLRVDGGWTAW